MSACQTLDPEFLSASAVIGHLADTDRRVKGFLIHIGKHENLAGLIILRNHRHQSVCIYFQIAPGKFWLKIVHLDAGIGKFTFDLHDIGLGIVDKGTTDTTDLVRL